MYERKKGVNVVIEDIQSMIVSGELQLGMRFPSERDLASRFGVSRNTVREAIHYFVMLGVASTKPGSGTYLANNSEALKQVVESRQLLEIYNWSEIQQARRVIEMGIVKISAANAIREDKVRLLNALEKLKDAERMIKTDSDIDMYLVADYELHKEIAAITHNTVLMELHASLRNESLAMGEIWKRFSNVIDVVNPTHEEIVSAIIRNDEEAASSAMNKHLCYMEYRINLAKTMQD